MTRRTTSSITMIVAVGMVGLGHAVAADTLESVEKQLVEKWGKVQSMSATMKVLGAMPNQTAEGKYEYAKKGDKSMYRMELSFGEQMSQTVVSDGEFLYVVMERMGQKQVMKATPDKAQAMDPVSQFAALRSTGELKLLPEQSVDGKAAYVIEATPTDKGQGKSVSYFAKETGAMIKVVTQDPSGATLGTMTMSDVKLNPKIDMSRFVFKAPDGVQVMDMTKRPSPAGPPPTSPPPAGPPPASTPPASTPPTP